MKAQALFMALVGTLLLGCSSNSSGGGGATVPGGGNQGQGGGQQARVAGVCVVMGQQNIVSCTEVYSATVTVQEFRDYCQQNGGQYGNQCPTNQFLLTCETNAGNYRALERIAGPAEARNQMIQTCQQQNGRVI